MGSYFDYEEYRKWYSEKYGQDLPSLSYLKQPFDMGDYRLLENIFIPVDWAVALVILKALKDPDGRKLFEKLAQKWLDTIGDAVTALAQAGSGNIISAYSNSLLISMLLEHNYMVRKGATGNLYGGLAALTTAEAAAQWLGGFSVPSSISFDTKKKSGGSALQGLGALKALFTK